MRQPAPAPAGTVAFSRAYPARPSQIRAVRSDLRELLDGCPVADEVVLCASELAANAGTATRASTAERSRSARRSAKANTYESRSTTVEARGPSHPPTRTGLTGSTSSRLSPLHGASSRPRPAGPYGHISTGPHADSHVAANGRARDRRHDSLVQPSLIQRFDNAGLGAEAQRSGMTRV